MKIGSRTIGEGSPCYVIAEAGSNHNRDFDTALKLIDTAVEAGADAVKFQIFSAEKIYSRKTPMASYLKKNKLVRDDETLWDLIKRIETPREWLPDLVEYCSRKGITFLATPFDFSAVDELLAVGVDAFKVASFEITHLPLLGKISQTGKPVILSTGMANLDDVELALKVISENGPSEVALLHCAIAYPVKFENLNLRVMDTLRQAFSLPAGFSDHTEGFVADIAAVARGACIIEKHFTLDRRQEGPDHHFALEPHELKQMVIAVRQTEAALGSPIKRHTAAEEELHRIARRSLVAAKNIPKDTVITREMLDVKRPGYGIHSRFIDIVEGRTAQCNIEEDEIITWEMI